jgi:predicted Rossmann fold flavoprotein
LPKRLWERLSSIALISDELRWLDISNKQLNKLIEELLRSELSVKGKTTFKEEFVTCGGVSLKDINLETMESFKCPGIYFAGEVIDVDGITGGFNFQAAWTTGYIAGKSMSGLDS